MRVGSRIEYDSLAIALSKLGDLVDKRAFVIGLVKLESHVWKLFLQSLRHVTQSVGSIDFRIAFSKAIEIRSIQNGYSLHDWSIYRLLESIARIFVIGIRGGNRLK